MKSAAVKRNSAPTASPRAVAHLLGKSFSSNDEIYQTLTTRDIQSAADLFRPMYDRLQGADGYVSLEVSPRLAHDTSGTIAEAHRLWAAVKCPNFIIKVPGTTEGISAGRQLVNDGMNGLHADWFAPVCTALRRLRWTESPSGRSAIRCWFARTEVKEYL